MADYDDDNMWDEYPEAEVTTACFIHLTYGIIAHNFDKLKLV